MSTEMLDHRALTDLQPAYGLWKLHAPKKAPHRFQATTRMEAKEWQARAREALERTLGFQSLPSA